jgi:hypothetical protein
MRGDHGYQFGDSLVTAARVDQRERAEHAYGIGVLELLWARSRISSDVSWFPSQRSVLPYWHKHHRCQRRVAARAHGCRLLVQPAGHRLLTGGVIGTDRYLMMPRS